MRTLGPAVAVLLLGLAGGCGSRPGEHGRATGGDEPTTARALAAVVEDHLAGRLGHATSARRELDVARALHGTGATLRYRAEDEPAKPAVSVAVGTRGPKTLGDCTAPDNDFYNGCETTDQGVLFWEKETPEEDPGVVYVTVTRGRTRVVVYQSGPRITGDPRDLDLRVPVGEMFAIAHDPRIGMTTSQAAVDAGKSLASWTNEP